MKSQSTLEGDWWLHKRPFAHYRASNVFNYNVYQELSSAFRSLIDSVRQQRGSFGRSAGYDADIYGLNNLSAASFYPLLSERWIAGICSLLGLPNSRHIDAALHSSLPGSRTGWIHTDYCSGWFDSFSSSPTSPLIFPNRTACDYFTGKRKTAVCQPKEYVRAATLIFYLCNDDWRPGAGGETALVACKNGGETDYVVPANNSLLLFSCSPHSYHHFVTNPLSTRNSIIFWVHQTLDEAVARWGA